jgi:cobalt/nickel transport system permease protein
VHVHFLDPYRAHSSPVHALDARVKFVLTVAFILTVSLTPLGAWPIYFLLLTLVLSAEILSSLGIGYVWKRASLALPFVLAALPVIFTSGGRPLFTFDLGQLRLAASAEGLGRFVNVALKSWLSVQVAIILASSTPFPDLLKAMRAVRVPRLLVAMFGLMWRYLFVFVDEALRLMRARTSRSGTPASGNGPQGSRRRGTFAWRARVTGGMAGSLFLRAFERSDRIYVAMLSRGYDGEVRSLALAPLTGGSRLALVFGLGLLGLLLGSALLLWS